MRPVRKPVGEPKPSLGTDRSIGGGGQSALWPADNGGGSYLAAAAIIVLAWLIGMAKPMSWALLELAVMIPTTEPLASRSGPPLLPGFTAASVWIRPVRSCWLRVDSSVTVIVRFSPEMMPWVT